ncbi:D-TA family PLP-dependent enzyme [Urechidicola vernalis]|uniref:D-TA family PLP-dependent enzyme n=1 Tax=Urechidicola vernalis TaxID=3075600 RepID=A0ABU2Y4R9_9FLAO|nr:D-TA family PLP-dependent enzyme [Urechidicola sp. P050]MDT0553193.1 D-TA family PLP-dependent enzyme [Urechidicola sp. P050]
MEWFRIDSTDDLVSPSLLVYPDRIRKNIELMIEIAGGTENLRPHIKTHKIEELVRIQQSYGIYKFKCATISEAELLGICEAEDVLIAMQPVGSQLKRYIELLKKYPKTKFSTLVDNEETLSQLVFLINQENKKVRIWLDINNGMNRTGIIPGEKAKELFLRMQENDAVISSGFHVYDGHIHIANEKHRKQKCDHDFQSVIDLKSELKNEGVNVNTIVAGGSITFPIHAQRAGVEVSPGTPVLWDAGYGNRYEDLNFLPAATLFTRVVSKPTEKTVCLDLGHKSVASEMAFPRVQFLGNIDISQLDQHEEHLVIEDTNEFEIGDGLYALPIHICPTVTKYGKVHVVENNKIRENWKVVARDHQLKI